MPYWKCTEAKIKDDGRLVEMSFKNEHGVSRKTITLSAKEWSEIMTYQFIAEQPERRWKEIQNELATDLFRAVQNKINEVKKGE